MSTDKPQSPPKKETTINKERNWHRRSIFATTKEIQFSAEVRNTRWLEGKKSSDQLVEGGLWEGRRSRSRRGHHRVPFPLPPPPAPATHAVHKRPPPPKNTRAVTFSCQKYFFVSIVRNSSPYPYTDIKKMLFNIKHICAMLKVLGFQGLSTKEPLLCYTIIPMMLYVHIMLFSINN